MALAMLAVLATLGLGVFSMVKGGEFNKKYANQLMRWRVGLQGVALLLFVLAMLARG
jgi:hypothetical protein